MSETESTHDEDQVVSRREAEFENYVQDANFAVYFKLARTRAEVECGIKNGTFFPDFVHQFFPEKERIFGYIKPVIKLYYSASRLKRYVRFYYEDSLTFERDGIEPDDVMRLLSPILDEIEYTDDLGTFLSELDCKEELEFKPPGTSIQEFELDYRKPKMLCRAQLEQLEQVGEVARDTDVNGTGTNGFCSIEEPTPNVALAPKEEKRYEIFHANSQTKAFARFQGRMQSLVMWFIESATMIDHQDPRWDFFMVFEKQNSEPSENSTNTGDRYFFVGYSTVYRYYAYPDRIRPRVSQMLILPPYRRNRVGTHLLQTIYDYYAKQPAVLDITAEDPDEDFISMRDFLDCKNCLGLPSFQVDSLKRGWSMEIAKEAQEKLKLCHRQSRKVYEILKLKALMNEDETELKNYRLEVKNRLNIPHQRFKRDCEKVIKKGFELPEPMRSQKDNEKFAQVQLDETYQELKKLYQQTISKLDQSNIGS